MSATSLFSVLVTMRNFGGSFASRLADAWLVADSANSARLAEAFPDLIEQYRAIHDGKAVMP